MSNIKREGNAIHFLINGGDKGVVKKSILLVVFSFAGILLLTFIGFGFDTPAFSLIALISGIPVMYLCFLIIGSGKFARYRVSFDGNAKKVRAEDLYNGITLWEAGFDASLLYFSKTWMQVGYVTSKKDALVYGNPVQDVVDDSPPTLRKSLLTISDRKRLESIAEEIIAFYGK